MRRGATPTPSPSPTPTPTPTITPTVTPPPSSGICAAFYYPWFPETWGGCPGGSPNNTHYHPSLGCYDSSSASTIQKHIEAMKYGNLQAAIASWWGPNRHNEQTRIPLLLNSGANGGNFKWTLYYEKEGPRNYCPECPDSDYDSNGNPKVSTIRRDLEYIRDNYASNSNYLKISGKFVVFVYGGPNNASSDESCEMNDRWHQAITNGTTSPSDDIYAYIVLKVFPGYKSCANQPNSWHQYAPASSVDRQSGYSYSISPGFWHYSSGTPQLARNLVRWTQNVKDMVASGEPWQLVFTFNEWGEGTAVESATEWVSASGYGDYLDALHNYGCSASAPTPTPTSSLTPTPPPGCTPDGCNGICPANCTGNDDPDCPGVCKDFSCVTDTDCTAPTAPKNLICQSRVFGVELYWTNTFFAVTGYKIYQDGNLFTTTSSGYLDHYFISLLTDFTMHDYQVSAYNSRGESPKSNIASCSAFDQPKTDLRKWIKIDNFKWLVANVYKWSLSIIGFLALLMIIIGGLMYTSASGDERKILTAKKVITYAIGGLVLILLAYVISSIIEKIFMG